MLPLGANRTARRATGGILPRGLTLLAAIALAWLCWEGGRGTLFSQTTPTFTNSPAPALVESNGVIIVPVRDKAGRLIEPMVLTPVAARSAPVGSNRLSGITTTPLKVQGAVGRPVSAAAPSQAAFDEKVLSAQVALVRRAISSGPLDGMFGSQTRAALRVFQEQQGLPKTGHLDATTLTNLVLEGSLYTNYVVTEADLSLLQPLGPTWLAKSQQSSLAYENVLELVSEKTFSNPKLVRWLNPGIHWSNIAVGASIQVVNAQYPPPQKAAFLRIHLGERKLQVWDAATNLLAHFPCSIAARVDKRPLGEELHIAALAPNPNYTFDPSVFPESAEAQQLGRKLILQPGPNNPVGAVWLGLDKPGYGIHGTPKPEEVGRTESHGCFRLANWNAEYLLQLISLGTPVFVEP